jgi:hypothetical protein
MQIDYIQLDMVLSALPFPLDKDEVVAQSQQAGANPQTLKAMKQALPDQTFSSSEDVKKCMQRVSQQGQQGQRGQQGQQKH